MPTITEHQLLPQAAAVEPAPVEAPVEPPKQEEAMSPKFAALARKERALRLEAQKIKSEREAWMKERDQEQAKYKSDYIPKDRLTRETLQVLQEAGIPPDQLAQMIMNAPQQADPLVTKLMARIDELEGKTTKVETDFKDQQTRAYEQAVNQVRNEAKVLIDSDPAYETIKATNNIEAVVEHIKQTFDQDGLLLSVEEAAKEVEDVLIDEAIKMASLNKVKQKLAPPPVEPKQQINPKQQPVKTLTRELVSSSTKPRLSEQDRKRRAVMRAQGLDPDTGNPISAR